MELKKINEKNYYFVNPSLIGLYLFEDNSVMIIDSGIDDSTAKKVLKIINENSWDLKYIFNTHSHADHCGGNSFLQKKCELTTIASSIESVLIENPLLEPSYLYGAFPQAELHNKFLKAKESKVDRIVTSGPVEIHGEIFEVVDLPGHSLGMIGLKTPDGISYLGDALFPEEIIDKHNLLFLYNYGECLETLEKLKSYRANRYVLSHGGLKDDLSYLIEYNLKSLNEVSDYIFSLLDDYLSLEEIHKKIAESFDIKEILPQYYLNISVIKAHLTYLCDIDLVYNEVIDSTVKWKKR